jgi:hypothetical protein
MAEPRLAALITGLIGLSFGTGFSAIVSIIGIIASLQPNVEEDKGPLVLCGASAVVRGLLLAIWLRNWRRLRRLRRGQQWILAAMCWALPIGTLAWLLVLVMRTM